MPTPTPLTIRRATNDDALPIARVLVESWKTTYTGIVPTAFLDAMKIDEQARMVSGVLAAGDRHILVAEVDGAVVGFIAGGAIRESLDDFDAELQTIYLLAAHQGNGAGRRLCQALIAELRASGYRRMAVWVLEQNATAVSFYQRIGGVQVAQKIVEIGGASLNDLAFGWHSLDQVT